MLTIVGLGNPGTAYKKTRHNAGFIFLDGILESRFIEDAVFHKTGIDSIRSFFGTGRKFKKTSGPYLKIEGELSGKHFLLVKPTTYMNESGKAFASLKTRGIIKDLSEVLVVVDDAGLNVGAIKLRQSGSAGGHNGLKSIISHLGTSEFPRLRIGVGPRPNGSEMVDYVLSTFLPEEFQIFKKSLYTASKVVEEWIKSGFTIASNVLSIEKTSRNTYQGEKL